MYNYDTGNAVCVCARVHVRVLWYTRQLQTVSLYFIEIWLVKSTDSYIKTLTQEFVCGIGNPPSQTKPPRICVGKYQELATNNNMLFKTDDVRRLSKEKISFITTESWKKC